MCTKENGGRNRCRNSLDSDGLGSKKIIARASGMGIRSRLRALSGSALTATGSHSLPTRSNPFQCQTKRAPQGCSFCLAEAEGFEPPWGFPQTVFKTFRILPESSRIIPNPPRFSAEFSLFFAPSRKFARKLRETCEKQLKSAPLQV